VYAQLRPIVGGEERGRGRPTVTVGRTTSGCAKRAVSGGNASCGEEGSLEIETGILVSGHHVWVLYPWVWHAQSRGRSLSF